MDVFKKEIPRCFHEDLLFATFLTFKRKKSVLFLLKNYSLYEIQSSKLLHIIDLNESFKDIINLEHNVQPQISEENYNITLGKFILHHGIGIRLYILLRIHDKLVVLERKDDGYSLFKEFRNVEKFQISDPDKLYQAHVYIFYVGQIESTKISFDNDTDLNENQSTDNFRNESKVKELVETIKKGRTELAAKVAETKKLFLETKNFETFGSNIIRSHVIEEKLILSRCGDIWMRVYNDFLVLGIPVANNCSERLTTLHNIRPILNFANLARFEYKYKLYELKKGAKHSNLNSLDSYEDSDDVFNMNDEWIPIKLKYLRPDSLAVITITLSLSNLYSLSFNEILCFVTYDIFHENHKFTQNLFVKKLRIDTEILHSDKYQLDFSIDSAIDFLTLVETSTRYNFIIDVPIESNTKFLFNFKTIIIEKLKFREYKRSTEAMEIENYVTEQTQQLKIFYKCDVNSGNFWYGTVIIFSQFSEKKFKIKMYSRSESKVFALIQLLYENSTEKIKIIPENCTINEDSLHNLEYALRDEINLGEEITRKYDNKETKIRTNIFAMQQTLFAKELQTDVCISQLKENLSLNEDALK